MRQRALRHEPLFHPLDARMPEEIALIPARTCQGYIAEDQRAAVVAGLVRQAGAADPSES